MALQSIYLAGAANAGNTRHGIEEAISSALRKMGRRTSDQHKSAAAEYTSSTVLITGPSRTADIEQTLVRVVPGPGEICAVIVDANQ